MGNREEKTGKRSKPNGYWGGEWGGGGGVPARIASLADFLAPFPSKVSGPKQRENKQLMQNAG